MLDTPIPTQIAEILRDAGGRRRRRPFYRSGAAARHDGRQTLMFSASVSADAFVASRASLVVGGAAPPPANVAVGRAWGPAVAGIEQRFVPADALRERQISARWRRVLRAHAAAAMLDRPVVFCASESARFRGCARTPTPARLLEARIDQGESRRGEGGRGDQANDVRHRSHRCSRASEAAGGLHAGATIARWTRSPPARAPRADGGHGRRLARTRSAGRAPRHRSPRRPDGRARLRRVRAPGAPDARVVEARDRLYGDGVRKRTRAGRAR